MPVISLAGGGAIVLPQEGRAVGLQAVTHRADSIGARVRPHAGREGKTMATIGIATSYGEGFLKAIERVAPARGFKVVADRALCADRPERDRAGAEGRSPRIPTRSIFAAGTPGALPQIELAKRGYKGLIYQTQGVANADFLRVGGKDLDGSYMTVRRCWWPSSCRTRTRRRSRGPRLRDALRGEVRRGLALAVRCDRLGCAAGRSAGLPRR